jgi:hypothetical protein
MGDYRTNIGPHITADGTTTLCGSVEPSEGDDMCNDCLDLAELHDGNL